MLAKVFVVALLAGVLSLDRKAAVQLMASQPIVAAPLVGWLLGDFTGALEVGALLQLLFAGSINVGAALPPHETLATVVIVGSAILAHGHSDTNHAHHAELYAAAILLLAPLGLVGKWFDQALERMNGQFSRYAERHVRPGGGAGAVALANFAAMGANFFVVAGIAFAATALGTVLLGVTWRALPENLHGFLATFYGLAPVLGIGTTLVVLRSRRGPALFVVTSLLAAGVIMVARRGG